jgi:hypothetical protein
MRTIAVFLLALSGILQAQDASLFTKEVAPLFAGKCVGCHSGNVKMGGLALDTLKDCRPAAIMVML